MTPGTDNLDVQWTLLEGGFEHFMVNISNEELAYSNVSITTNKNANFANLIPGRMFVITVTAVAGNFSNSSEPSLFATSEFPPYFPAYCSKIYSHGIENLDIRHLSVRMFISEYSLSISCVFVRVNVTRWTFKS